MNKLKLLTICISSVLLLGNCSKILEPVLLIASNQDISTDALQEEFEINIKSLTFKTSQKANNAPYTRRLKLTGSGSKANVFDETKFLKSNFPKPSRSPDYLLGIGDQISFTQLNGFKSETPHWPSTFKEAEYLIGIGDQISFTQLNEFKAGTPHWPPTSKEAEYLLGAGDELTFMQSNDNNKNISITYNDKNEMLPTKVDDKLVSTQGVIGSNGNILLYGLGNILVINRTLDDVRTEVRNILIRNGLAPNFQLEISKFQSKKAFVTDGKGKSKTLTLNNLPITLREVALGAGLSESNKSFIMIKLTRDEQEFRFTTGQLFDLKAPEITIQDNDQIEIQVASETSRTIQSVVGSKGNILLGNMGSISAVNRTVDDIYEEVRSILIRNGLTPNFQLEISKFQSKKAFVTDGKDKSKTLTLNNLPITLREVALGAGITETDKNFALIKLTRDEREFRFTADQLFDLKAPEITIQDNDQIEIQVASETSRTIQSVVGSKGNILLGNMGSISAVNRTVDDIYEEVRSILIRNGTIPSFQLELTKFASKKAYLIQKNIGSSVIPLTNSKMTLRELILEKEIPVTKTDSLSLITLKRNGQIFRMTADQILDPQTQSIWLIDKDQIEIESLAYKPGQVFALSGAGSAQIVPINPSKRETLADIIFAENGALNNLLAKRSEVYLLRGKNPSVAYHLDAQNVSRVLVAAKTELRPNDIVYVADRPIISFSRVLTEILPLRILLRDVQNNDIP